jgi:hypothetical protein
MNAQKKLGLPLKEIIDAMRSGELPPVAVEGSGLSGLQFGKESVKALFARIQVDLATECGLSTSLAAKQLGTTTMNVLWLLRLGYLERVVGPAPNITRISTNSIREFESKWVSSGKLALRFGTSRMLVNRALRMEGLRSIEGTGADRYSVPYFAVREVVDVNIEQALFCAAKTRGRDSATYQRECRRRAGKVRVGERVAALRSAMARARWRDARGRFTAFARASEMPDRAGDFRGESENE